MIMIQKWAEQLDAIGSERLIKIMPIIQEWAEQLDAMAPEAKLKDFPLLGVPVSIKDTVMVKGMDSTNGLMKARIDPARQDAVYVQILKKLGAVPFVKTNVPQLCLS